jgi:hypothetical protein
MSARLRPALLLLVLASPALAQTRSTTTEELRFQGVGTAFYYPGQSVTTEELVFHGAGMRYYYPGYSVTTETLVFQGTRNAVPTPTAGEVAERTGLGARQARSGLSRRSPEEVRSTLIQDEAPMAPDPFNQPVEAAPPPDDPTRDDALPPIEEPPAPRGPITHLSSDSPPEEAPPPEDDGGSSGVEPYLAE